ncbi:hypothetical protein Avbf_07413 [Armadillidium vulgare]|nr:hypothetical protein Avbf_07413 [Armadillidium vulgare]
MKNIFIIAFIFSLSFISFSLCSAKPHSKASEKQSTSNMVWLFWCVSRQTFTSSRGRLGRQGFFNYSV